MRADIGAGAQVLHAITDHRAVIVTLQLQVQKVSSITRQVWQYQSADWDRLRDGLSQCEWIFNEVDEAALALTEGVLHLAKSCIETKQLKEQKGSHPWINDSVMELVCARRDAAGTSAEAAAVLACSKGIMKQFVLYSQHTCKA